MSAAINMPNDNHPHLGSTMQGAVLTSLGSSSGVCWLVVYGQGHIRAFRRTPDSCVGYLRACGVLQVTDVRFIDRGRRVLLATQHGVEVGATCG